MADEQIKSFWFCIEPHFGYDISIGVFSSPPDDASEETPDEAFEIQFPLPKQGLRLFIVNDFGIVMQKDFDNAALVSDTFLKIFSQIHGSMPFDGNCYPKIAAHIRKMAAVIDKRMKTEIADNIDGHNYFVFAIDSDGNQQMAKMLNPIC